MPNITPVIRCQKCEHPIDDHTSGCQSSSCECRMTPNLIANGAVYAAVTAGLTK